MPAAKKKSWKEKLNTDGHPHIETVEKDFGGLKKGQLMLIPTPLLVDAYIRQIPKGKKADMALIRKDLAAEYHAEVTCPLTTGIFVRIAAEAAYEAYTNGEPLDKITPFWRAIDVKSPAAKKLSFGTDLLIAQQKKEGILK
jgi:hypothetical protein